MHLTRQHEAEEGCREVVMEVENPRHEPERGEMQRPAQQREPPGRDGATPQRCGERHVRSVTAACDQGRNKGLMVLFLSNIPDPVRQRAV